MLALLSSGARVTPRAPKAASSIASLLLTAEAFVSEIPEEKRKRRPAACRAAAWRDVLIRDSRQATDG